MIILNHYDKASEILYIVIYKEPLTPTVYAIVTQVYVKSKKEYITQCNTITNYATHRVCQTKKSNKTSDKNNATKLNTCRKQNGYPARYLFSACKKLDESQRAVVSK